MWFRYEVWYPTKAEGVYNHWQENIAPTKEAAEAYLRRAGCEWTWHHNGIQVRVCVCVCVCGLRCCSGLFFFLFFLLLCVHRLQLNGAFLDEFVVKEGAQRSSVGAWW